MQFELGEIADAGLQKIAAEQEPADDDQDRRQGHCRLVEWAATIARRNAGRQPARRVLGSGSVAGVKAVRNGEFGVAGAAALGPI